MEKVFLTSNEFLSLYTGILLGDDFSVVTNGLSKVFDYPVLTLDTVKSAQEFRRYINLYRPDLFSVMKKIGKFVKDESLDINKQVDEYVKKFEREFGSSKVAVQKLNKKLPERCME